MRAGQGTSWHQLWRAREQAVHRAVGLVCCASPQGRHQWMTGTEIGHIDIFENHRLSIWQEAFSRDYLLVSDRISNHNILWCLAKWPRIRPSG